MNRTAKIVLGVLVGLVALVVVVFGGTFAYASHAASARLAETFPDVQPKNIPIPWPLTPEEIEAIRQEKLAALPPGEPLPDGTMPPPPDVMADVDLDAIATERGMARAKVLLESRLGCGECHGMDGAGTLVADAQPVWTWYAPNITRGGTTKDYTGADWDRTIRHGVKPDGTPVTMPAVDFQEASDQEVADIATWFWNQPPVDAQQPDTVIGPLGKVLIGFGQIPLSAEEIDHTKDHLLLPPPAAVDLAYGRHVASTCVGCHREQFNGGPIKQGPPDWAPAANLTALKGWTEADFVRVFREGKKPDGSEVAFPMTMMTKAKMSDTDLSAIWLYLQTLPEQPTGE